MSPAAALVVATPMEDAGLLPLVTAAQEAELEPVTAEEEAELEPVLRLLYVDVSTYSSSCACGKEITDFYLSEREKEQPR